MPKVRPQSVKKVRPHRTLAPRRLDASTLPLSPAIALDDAQRGRLTEFQRFHVEFPPLSPTLFKTVVCAVVDRDDKPLRRRGKPIKTQVFWEVAECNHTTRPRCGYLKRPRWYFIAWDRCGGAVEIAHCPSLRAALARYNAPAESFLVPQARDSLLFLKSKSRHP